MNNLHSLCQISTTGNIRKDLLKLLQSEAYPIHCYRCLLLESKSFESLHTITGQNTNYIQAIPLSHRITRYEPYHRNTSIVRVAVIVSGWPHSLIAPLPAGQRP